MNQAKFRTSSFWTLCAGIAIGAISVASIIGSGRGTNIAHAQILPPSHSVSYTSSESAAELRSLDKSFANLAEFASPAVVQIRVKNSTSTDMLGRMMPVAGEGSGVVIRPDGYIVTNDHVVGGFDKVQVVLQDGREFPGSVMRAEESDIAVVKIDAKDLPTLSFAESDKVRPGEFSIAIGSPFGFENSVTVGHISALGRSNAIRDGMARMGVDGPTYRVYTGLIQTDTPINMGNSGGPLINIDGQIIGINTSIYSQSGGSNGIGFAIPSNQARMISEMLIEKKKIVRAALGLTPIDLKEYQKKELKLDGGAYVGEVLSNGPSGAAGIKKGDVIVRVGQDPVRSQMDVRNSMFRHDPGSNVDVELVRNGDHKVFKVKLIDAAQLRKLQTPAADENADTDRSNPFTFPTPRMVPPQSPDRPHTGKAKLGVSIATVDDKSRQQFGIPKGVNGAVVLAVQPGSVADQMLNMQPGDVIQRLDGKKIDSAEALTKLMQGVNWGDKRSITFSRYSGNSQSTMSVDVVFN